MKKIAISIGDRFGKYVVVSDPTFVEMPSGNKVVLECRCDCGAVRKVQRQNLLHKKSSQCKTCRMKQLSDAEYRNRCINRKTLPDGQVNINCCFGGYKRGASRRGLDFELNLTEFMDLTELDCYYCGSSPSNKYELKRKDGRGRGGKPFVYNGIDRIDNTIGYVKNNCIPCCFMCNKAKGSMDYSEFMQWINVIVNFTQRSKHVETLYSC